MTFKRNRAITQKLYYSGINIDFSTSPDDPSTMCWTLLNSQGTAVAIGNFPYLDVVEMDSGKKLNPLYWFTIDDETLCDIAKSICTEYPDSVFADWYNNLTPEKEPMPPAWENIFLTLLHNSTKDRTVLKRENADVLISSTDEIYSALKEKWRL